MNNETPRFISVAVMVSLSHALLSSLSLMSKESLPLSWFIRFGFLFPEAALHVLFQPLIGKLSCLPSRQLLDWLEDFRQNHISLDQDLALEPNQDRTCLTVLPLLRRWNVCRSLGHAPKTQSLLIAAINLLNFFSTIFLTSSPCLNRA